MTLRISRNITALLAAALLMGCGRREAPAMAAEASVVSNGGFEKSQKGLPAGWNIEADVLAKGTVSVDSDRRKNGQSSLKLSPNKKNTPGPRPLAVGMLLDAKPLRGQEVELSAWLAADPGAIPIVGLAALRRDGKDAGGAQIGLTQPSNDFVLKANVLKVPNDPAVESLVVYCSVSGVSGSAWFDDVTVRSRSPKAQVDQSNDASELHARVHVDARRVLRSIPRTLFGTNVEWIFEANGLWDKSQGKTRPDVTALTKDAQVSLIRFPGGVFSDTYHWREGVGPQDKRPTALHFPGGPSSRHSFGTNEALAFAHDVNARLLLTVNAGTGTPQEAADWVRYVNGEKKSRTDRVELWEVGNELYMKDDLSKSSIPPEKYAKLFREFARAMRQANPRIRIAAIGGENYGRFAFNSYPHWNEIVLREAGADMDYLSIHNAYAPVVMERASVDPREVYEAMLAAPLNIADNLRTVSDQIDKFAGPRASQVKIAVTEWGPMFHVDPRNSYIDHPKTLGSAVYVASVLKAFIDSPRVEIANFFKLSEPTFMGWIGPRDGKYIPKPSFMAFQLIATHLQEQLVASSVDGPTYDSPTVGVVDAVRNAPYVEVVASRSADGKKLVLLAICKHFSRPVRAKISLDGFHPAKSSTAWTLDGAGLDANTGTELLKIPGFSWGKQTSVPPWRRIDHGGPGEVQIRRRTIEGVGAEFSATLPPLSITIIELPANR